MKSKCSYLFVYGSLRKGFQHSAYNYIKRYFDFVADAKTKGVMVDMGEFPAASPSNDAHYIVGELYQLKNLSEYDFAFAQLDDYEGLCVEAGEIPMFRRELVIAETETDNKEAWVYWFNDSIEGYPLIASGDILDFLNKKSK